MFFSLLSLSSSSSLQLLVVVALYVLLLQCCGCVKALDSPSSDWTCSTNIFTAGRIDVERMLYNCSENIPGARVPPSYFPRVLNDSQLQNVSNYDPIILDVQLAVNNLIKVSDITNEFTLDFFLRLVWTDDRIVMPNIWSYLHPETSLEGIEISRYIQSQDELKFWLPDIYFYESTDVEVINSLVKILPEGRMFWARHMIVTFSDPTMPFNQYPVDHQNFSITLESFSYDHRFIELRFLGDDTIKLLTDGDTGNEIIRTNQLWEYEGFQAKVDTTDAPSPVNPERKYSTLFLKLNFQRQSTGIVYRLALPILIFILIVGVAFWSDASNRIEVTLQMILVVSALYIIIGQSIPLVGYLTRIDSFIIMVFIVMGATLAIHFYCVNLTENKIRHPMNAFYRDLIMISLKGTWLPASVGLFTYFFRSKQLWYILVIIIFSFFCFLYTVSNINALFRRFQYSIFKLKLKQEMVQLGAIDEKTEKPLQLTMHEKFVMTLANFFYGDKALLAMFNDCNADRVDRMLERQDSKNLLRSPHLKSHVTESTIFNEEFIPQREELDDVREDSDDFQSESGSNRIYESTSNKPFVKPIMMTGNNHSVNNRYLHQPHPPHRSSPLEHNYQYNQVSQRKNNAIVPPSPSRHQGPVPPISMANPGAINPNKFTLESSDTAGSLEEYGHHNPREAFFISRSHSAHSSNHIVADQELENQLKSADIIKENPNSKDEDLSLHPEMTKYTLEEEFSRLSTIAEGEHDEENTHIMSPVEIVVQQDEDDPIKDKNDEPKVSTINKREIHYINVKNTPNDSAKNFHAEANTSTHEIESPDLQDYYGNPSSKKYYELSSSLSKRNKHHQQQHTTPQHQHYPHQHAHHRTHSHRAHQYHPIHHSDREDDRHEALMQFKLHTASKMGVVFNSKAHEHIYVTNAHTIPRSFSSTTAAKPKRSSFEG